MKASILIFILGLILTLSLLWPLAAAPYFTHHDDVQVIRLFEMDKCFKDGQIPCRWVPDLGGLYGYPLFNFYAPLPYYFGELIYFFSQSLIFSAKVMFGVSFVGSFVFMFLLGRKLWGDLGGLVSGIFYSFAPYHAVAFYVRGAMEEMWALMLFPAIFWAVLKLNSSTKVINALLLALFLALLILSHNLSSMIFIPIMGALIGLKFYESRDLRFLKLCFLGFALGLILSIFYWLPMLMEKNLVHVETTTFGYFSYTEHFKGLRKLFLDHSWGWGASVREVPGGEKDGMSFQIGWIHLLGWFLALFGAKKLWKKNRPVSMLILFSSLIVTGSVFMIHPRSLFIWKLIEPLKYIQFPWRFLMIITFFISLVSGSIFLWLNDKWKKVVGVLLIATVIVLNFSYFRPEKFLQESDNDFLTGKGWDKQIKRSIFDFLPIYAKAPPAELATFRYEILTGDAQISDFKEGTNWLQFQADIKTHTIIRLSQYYFPNWQITVDGQRVQPDYKSNYLGLMNLILAPGNHYIEGRLMDTPVRAASNTLSIVGVCVAALLLVWQIPRVRRWSHYYFKSFNR